MDKLKIGSEEMRTAGRTAKAILELYESGKFKWGRWDSRSKRTDRGRTCLLEAEAKVLAAFHWSYVEETPFRRCFKESYFGGPPSGVYSFNDKPGRTYKQIKAALEKIIAAGER